MGVAFQLKHDYELACAVEVTSENASDEEISEAIEHARCVFALLHTESSEFASACLGHTLRISVMSGFTESAREPRRVVDCD